MQESHRSHWFSRPGRRKSLHTERNRVYPFFTRNQRELERESEYKTRTEWHHVISWSKLAEWTGKLQKGAYIEVEGELRYREYTPAESDRSIRVAEIHASSILVLDRSERQPVATSESQPIDEPLD